MKKHTKLYFEYFDYDRSSFIPCELTGLRAVDIHHIRARGMGGTKKAETIENLMAATREMHLLYGDKQNFISFLDDAHANFLETQEPFITNYADHPAFDELLTYNDLYKTLIKNARRNNR